MYMYMYFCIYKYLRLILQELHTDVIEQLCYRSLHSVNISRVSMHVCAYVCEEEYVCELYVSVYLLVHMYVYMYIHTYKYLFTYTYVIIPMCIYMLRIDLYTYS